MGATLSFIVGFLDNEIEADEGDVEIGGDDGSLSIVIHPARCPDDVF
jgi:hypothetical protein